MYASFYFHKCIAIRKICKIKTRNKFSLYGKIPGTYSQSNNAVTISCICRE